MKFGQICMSDEDVGLKLLGSPGKHQAYVIVNPGQECEMDDRVTKEDINEEEVSSPPNWRSFLKVQFPIHPYSRGTWSHCRLSLLYCIIGRLSFLCKMPFKFYI